MCHDTFEARLSILSSADALRMLVLVPGSKTGWEVLVHSWPSSLRVCAEGRLTDPLTTFSPWLIF